MRITAVDLSVFHVDLDCCHVETETGSIVSLKTVAGGIQFKTTNAEFILTSKGRLIVFKGDIEKAVA
jgi:hypothetical protein